VWDGGLDIIIFQMSEHSSQPKKFKHFVTLCGRKFRDTDPAYFPRLEYRGRTIYLCTESCLGAFLADPDIFYKVHRNSEKGKEHVETR
jgi:YHS domain-containing protein